jgi:hypothetical protein
MPKHLESVEQRLFVQRFRLDPNTRDLPACAIPNGGRRGAREAGILKGEGVTAGAPDWILMVPRGPFCGLALEFKSPSGPVRVSPAQVLFLERLAHHGWSVHIVRNAHEAWQHVTAYLTLQIA